ncbi:MAG: hypothetical protein KH092_02240 [Actinomyces sp.]|nr:hypothetical protein [Actinomyces sp.]
MSSRVCTQYIFKAAVGFSAKKFAPHGPSSRVSAKKFAPHAVKHPF